MLKKVLTLLNSKLIKSVGVYTLSNIINAAIPFLLLPFLTTYLSPADYGIVSVFQVLSNLLLPLTGLNFASAISLYFYEKEIKFDRFVGNSLIILYASTVVLILLFLLFNQVIIKISFGAESLNIINYYWMVIIVVFVFCQNLAQTLLTIWQVTYKSVQFGIFKILRTAFDILLSVYFIIVLQMTWEGRMYGQFIAMLLFAIVAFIILIKNKKIDYTINKSYIKSILKYGIPLIPHVLSGVIVTYSDRLFIINMKGLDETGLYSVGYQVGMVIYLVKNSFNQAWVPWFFEKLKLNERKIKLKIVYFTYFYNFGLLILAIIWVIFAPLFFKYFIHDSYLGAEKFVFWIAIAFSFNGMYTMFVNYLFYLKKTGIIAKITVLIALLNIILNYILIKLNGTIGAAQATAISFFVCFILAWIIAQKHYPMPWFKRYK